MGHFYKLFLTCAVLFLPTAQAATPVLVRFGDLAWVGAREGLPRNSGGRIMVPPLAACDLLGLNCQVRGSSVDASGPMGKLSVQLHQGFTELRPLTLITGQDIHYDPKSSAAVVSVNAAFAAISQQAKKANVAPWLDVQRRLSSKSKVLDVPLSAELGPQVSGKPKRTLKLSSSQQLQGAQLTLYSKLKDTLNIVGSLTPSTPDNPNRAPNCAATCTLGTPRDALWVLAYLSK